MGRISASEQTLERAVDGAYFNTWLRFTKARRADRSGAPEAEVAAIRYKATLEALADLLVHAGEDILVRDPSAPTVCGEAGLPILTLIPSTGKAEELLLRYAAKHGLTDQN